MRPRQVIAATLVALALGAATLTGSASAQGPTQGNLPSGVERYIPPGPMAPVVIIASADATTTAPPAVVMPPGVPSPRDEISVRGAYAGNDARQLYCIVYSRGC
jgi:hypothetical protein